MLKESTFYQALVEERNKEKWLIEGERRGLERGRREGLQEGVRKGYIKLLRRIVPFLQGLGVAIEPLLKLAGVTQQDLEDEVEAGEQE